VGHIYRSACSRRASSMFDELMRMGLDWAVVDSGTRVCWLFVGMNLNSRNAS
jgi:hypothetical protein